MQPRFQIGDTFTTRGRFPRHCTIVDILSTYNSAGELVKLCYVAEHDFAGQKVTDRDVCETTVAMGSVK